MNKLKNILFSPITFAMLLLIAAFSMGIATFIENDYGPEGSRAAVYNTKWFEAVLVLLTINMLGSIFSRKLYRKEKISVFLFHISFVLILLGAGITRYFGYEGLMHIREGESSNSILIQEKVVKAKLVDASGITADLKVRKDLVKHPSFNKSISTANASVDIKLKEIAENAYKKAVPVEGGKPMVGFVVAGNDHRGFEFLAYGTDAEFGDLTFSFQGENDSADVRFIKEGSTFYIECQEDLMVAAMGGESEKAENNKAIVVEKKLFNTQGYNVVIQELYESAAIQAVASEASNTAEGKRALIFEITSANKTEDLVVWEKDIYHGGYAELEIGNENLSLAYTYNRLDVDFELLLNDFKIERYPGSNSPSSFSSFVTIHDKGDEPKPFHIYMNNILKHGGYRFYQSSYDTDELGTVLSVNHDGLGTFVTYAGYFLLIFSIVLSMLNKNTFLWNPKIKMDKVAILLFALLLSSTALNAENIPTKEQTISAEHANSFGELLVQNTKGRTEPMHTFASDLIRKLSRSENLYGLNPVQVFIEMNINYSYWTDVPLIKVSHRELQKELGLSGKYASYNDFLSGSRYKLQNAIESAYGKSPAKRSKYDKAVMKADERMNICYAIFSGSYFKIFPIPDQVSTVWYTPGEAYKHTVQSEDSLFLSTIMPYYFNELIKSKGTNNYKLSDELLNGIKQYQRKNANYDLPSASRTKLEILYNSIDPFKKLFSFYATLGILFLFTLIILIIRGGKQHKGLMLFFYYSILVGFLVHTIGLAIRWYLSGHAPMSNGYESMVFIAWVTVLAGFLFSKNSWFALAATSVLAGFTLMVANLSFMDPQITNLVPVLQSYWLTMHVSIITGSYGFLGLGMLLGLINLILFIARNKKNENRINATIEELSKINNKTLSFGLYFLTIGTFLGAIWANESWGRYWGWDPKETWSLITIFIYTLVTHARMIPGLRGVFAYNVFSIYAFFSVLMTYFGVNYYLSGLHSYAAGDPVPIPTFVYYTVASLIIITLLAYYRTKKHLES